MILLALALLTAPDPTPEALALGRRLAETGTLAALLPVIAAKEIDELAAEHPDWSEAELADYRKVAREVAERGTARLMDATGRAYAERLPVGDLRALVRFNESAPAKRWREATPGAVLAAMQALGGMDFKNEVRSAYCGRTGKGCPVPPAVVSP